MILIVSFVLALVCGALVYLFSFRPNRRPKLRPDQPGLVFLAEDGVIVDETAAARQAMGFRSTANWEWRVFVDAFAARFPDLPDEYEVARAKAPTHFLSAVPGDAAKLAIGTYGRRLKIELQQAASDRCLALHHLALLDQIALNKMTRTISQAPYPIWVVDKDNREIWRSPEYARLRAIYLKGDAGDDRPLFRIGPAQMREQGPLRYMLPDQSEFGEMWFEISMSEDDGTKTFFAVNVTSLVRAERAQRGFVQTLTKTFAQLGTGLAIFDKDRQLVLFNPALIDLTQMSAEFLSSRPTLTSFFDWLREARVMPEPRDYSEWRNKLKDLTEAAAEGTFSELWSLPGGLSYRVFGRPHPDGAIAFLFEDVTAELSLTRNFVTELEITHSLLDTLPQAIATFSPTGDVLSVNRAYRDLWGEDLNTQVQPMPVAQILSTWKDQCEPTVAWCDIQQALTHPAKSKDTGGDLMTLKDKKLSYKVTPLSKGASAIVFTEENGQLPSSLPGDILA